MPVLAVVSALLVLTAPQPVGGTPAPVLSPASPAAAPEQAAVPSGPEVVLGPASVLHVTSYRVQPGDTLSHIAARLGVSTRALAAANGISNPDRIIVGTRLTAPGASSGSSGSSGAVSGGSSAGSGRHTVRPGEALSTIAARYGVSTRALASANGISNPNLVYAGTRLVIPAGSGAGAGSVSASAGHSGSVSGSLPLRLQNSPSRLALMPTFDRWAAHYGVPADLLKAMTWLESGWQNSVVSSTGAVGIGQLMPITVRHMEQVIGLNLDPRSPSDNIRMSARYLKLLIAATGSSRGALAAYYQGIGSVQRNGLYDDTRVYVDNVSALRARF